MIPEVDMMHNVVLLEDTWKNEKCREVEYALRCITHLHCQFCMQIVWVFVALIQILPMVYICTTVKCLSLRTWKTQISLITCFGSANSSSCMQQMLSAFFFCLGLHTMCVGLSIVLDNTHKKHIPMCQWKKCCSQIFKPVRSTSSTETKHVGQVETAVSSRFHAKITLLPSGPQLQASQIIYQIFLWEG